MKISRDLLDKITKITRTDYEPFVNENEELVMIDEERITTIIEDLIWEIGMRDEKIEDMQTDINENYIPVRTDPYDELGINENDF